jgi:diacylglycerol kinase family enzyme
MPGTKGILLLNPSAGAKMPPDEQEAFARAVAAADLELVPIGPDVDCVAVVRERIRQGRRLAIAAGGDGTINAVIQALVNTDAVLGVIPIGTFNHFARDLGLPLTWRDALDVVLSGTTKQIDAARVNDRFFVNNVSMGLYPELVRRREEKGREYPRWKARLHAFYATMQKYPHVAVTLESANHAEAVRTHILMVSNNTYDLSRIGIDAPRSTLEEGRLSIYWLPHMPRVKLTSFVAHYLAGRVRTAPGFRSFRTARVKVQASTPTLSIGIDGEVATMTTPLVITTVPQSLLVKVPRNAAEDGRGPRV